jgi:cyclase
MIVLRKRIVVCLDVRDGEVVKGVQFKGLQRMGDPVELAHRYQLEGADEVVFLDISASLEGRQTTLEVVQRTAEKLFVPLTVGGGVHDVADVAGALRAGADKISINTAAVTRPEVITEAADRFGSQCVVASIDALREGPEDDTSLASGYRVYTHGGSVRTDLDAVAWAQECAERGAGEILLTAIHCDGNRTGYDVELTRTVVDAVSVPVVASGGAGVAQHLRDVFVSAHADAALVAGIFHDGCTSVAAVKRSLAAVGVPVRTVEEER